MGADCIVVLPRYVKIRDVANVVGILAGLPKSWYVTPDKKASWIEVAGVTRVGYDTTPEMARIDLSGPMVNGENKHTLSYHFETDAGTGRVMYPKSTPFWIAVAKGLVDFFGGCADYNDGDDVEIDYEKRPVVRSGYPNDNIAWNAFQKELDALQPVTKAEMKAAKEFAAYE